MEEKQTLKERSCSERSQRKEKSVRTSKIVRCAILAALICVMSQIAFPLPSGIPVTMQTFAISFAGFFASFTGVAALFVFLLLGAVGVPVFANFQGGLSALTGLTAGYLVGFVPLCIACAVRYRTKNKILNLSLTFLTSLVGLAACHALGVWWFSFQSGNGFLQAFLLASAPYLLKDVLSLAFGLALSEILKRRLPVSA